MQPPAATSAELPPPDAISRQHSERVAQSLRQRMRRQGGSLSFAEYMHHVLYEPGLGYYAAGATKLGAAGDFVTAPEISPLFGRVIARQCARILQQAPGYSILELGAGSGALAEHLLLRLEALDAVPRNYFILDVSADLRERQQRRLQQAFPALAERIVWLDRLPARFCGVLIANEVADALPVERFRKTNDGVSQLRIAESSDRFVWQAAAAPAWLASAVAELEKDLEHTLPAGYVSEWSPGIGNWIADIANCVDEALLLLFDYGVARRDYYAADRNGGWLRCHFRHRVHNDPLIYPGIQDVSAWVDFTSVAAAAASAGLNVDAWLTQAHFLLHGGLTEELQEMTTTNTTFAMELSRQAKLLTLPGEMGEHFKCMALSRGSIALDPDILRADRSHVL